MPTYLCHGFRWNRLAIRLFVIVNDLEDAVPDWIVGRTSASVILDQFRHAYDFLPSRPLVATTRTEEEVNQKKTLHRDHDMSPPPPRVPALRDEVLMHHWSPVMLLEEYDADETASVARPYAYVADHAVRVDLGASVATEIAKYQSMTDQDGDGWFEKLRDKLRAGEDIQWYVVVCGDAERAVSEDELEDREDGTDQGEEEDRHRKEGRGEDDLPPPTKEYPIPIRQKLQAPPPRPVETDRPTPARVCDEIRHVATSGRHSPPPVADPKRRARSPA